MGQSLRKQVKKTNYLALDEFITKHPEFKQIRDEAKQRILDRLKKYKESSQGSAQAGRFGVSQFNDSVFDLSPPNLTGQKQFFAAQNSPFKQKENSADNSPAYRRTSIEANAGAGKV